MTTALLLGIDTGGTFTDAVLIDDATQTVVAKAKAPTTHGDLITGVKQAMAEVLEGLDCTETTIALVSLSTTLATNALVEGSGDPACLFTMGFSDDELARASIHEVGPDCLLRQISGGHDAHGNPVDEVDLAQVQAELDAIGGAVSAFAVASQFSVRNPQHEREVANYIARVTSKPVTCSHELSPQLGGPRRALTALLNARLISTIVELIAAVRSAMTNLEIDAPLMIVRGDGTLVAADFAARRPIETVLSGPAASVVGALHISQIDAGLVVDIGGTTTDVAVVRNGSPATTTAGALVGGHRTMVEAIDVVTEGLGGDSEVRIDSRHGDGPILLGPQRAIPIGRLALEHRDLVVSTLERQLLSAPNQGSDGRFLVPLPNAQQDLVLDDRERSILGRMAGQPMALATVATSGLLLNAVTRLCRRGLVRVASFTSTDALQVVGRFSAGRNLTIDGDASSTAARVLARQTRSNGLAIADSHEAFSELVIALLERQSSQLLLRVALAGDGLDAPKVADSAVVQAALSGHSGLLEINLALRATVLAIGAPAAAFYPNVANGLSTSATIPEHGDVANAIGAVVGRIEMHAQATITQPTKGQFRLHLYDQENFGSAERARDAGLAALTKAVRASAERAGANEPEVTHSWSTTTAMVEGKEVFVEGLLVVSATGRPRF
ncbi:MAG: hydantoinase/oxoprolinase family protein [Acidimicrobiales bacterium]